MTDQRSKIEIQIAKKKQGLTSFSGLYAIMELWDKLKLPQVIAIVV